MLCCPLCCCSGNEAAPERPSATSAAFNFCTIFIPAITQIDLFIIWFPDTRKCLSAADAALFFVFFLLAAFRNRGVLRALAHIPDMCITNAPLFIYVLFFSLTCRRKPTWACTPEGCQKADWTGQREEGRWWALRCCKEAEGCWNNATEAEKGGWRRETRRQVQVKNDVWDEFSSTFQEHPMFSILPDIYENGSVIFV